MSSSTGNSAPFLLLEFILAALVAVLAFVAPRLGNRAFVWIEQVATARLSTPARQIVTVGLAALLLRGLLLPWLGPAQAVVHDEQSLLLQAQTHLLGRLAMPVHPFWEHFETFHVNQVPAYASVYFPGRSVPLAAGLLIAGEPWVGVWLTFILMSMATVWMLQAWVPAPLALLGGVLVVLRFGIFSYWVNALWGGSFTALGAMLVVGAVPRLLERPGWRIGLVLGLGTAILATSRPYEGALLCLPIAFLLAVRWLRADRPGWSLGLAKAALPAIACVAAALALLLGHNVATSGEAANTAYGVNRSTYANAPAFLVSPPVNSQQRGPPHMRAFYDEEARPYERRTSAAGLAIGAVAKLAHNWRFYVGPILSFALVAGLWAVRRNAFLIGSLGFFMAAYMLETWNFPHYTAPVMPLILIVLMRGFQQLRTYQWRQRPVGVFLTRAMPVGVLLTLALPASTTLLGTPRIEESLTQACCVTDNDSLRHALSTRLRAIEGKHLVLVASGPHNPVHYEIVYNDPDLEAARIVWARNLDPQRDSRLIDHFKDRQVWQFEWRPDLPAAYTLTRLSGPAEPPPPRP